MSFPPLLLGAALLFWGWQTGQLAVGAPLALLLEAPNATRLRFELREADYRRIADFCTVLLAGVALLLVVTRDLPRGVVGALQWLPAVLAPLVLAQRFGASGRIRLTALFHYLRRRQRREPSMHDPLVDLSGVYLAAAVIAAGAANAPGYGYYAGVVSLTAWALFALRPKGAPAFALGLLLGIGAGAGYLGHVGLANLQTAIGNWVSDYFLRAPDDPQRTRTDIGSIGRLKLQDSILLRLYARPAQAERVKLLHTASFNVFAGNAWVARGPAAGPAASGFEDETGFLLSRTPPEAEVQIALRAERGRALLALPAGTVGVAGFPAASLQRAGLGAVQAQTAGGWVRYEARYAEDAGGYAAPMAADLLLPEPERASLERIAAELGLRGAAPREAAARVARHLEGFSYSTWRERGPAPGMSPLEDFLLVTRSGHCEYFAAAATLLLRAGGVPARYATGYAALESSALEGAWLVRARHAHAWARAFVDGRWIDLDTTPASWLQVEAGRAPGWEGLADIFRWALFRWSQRSEDEAGGAWWLLVAALTAILAWRLLSQRRAVRAGTAHAASAARRAAGADSEFYAVERALARRYRARGDDEPLARWSALAEANLHERERATLRELLELHHRHRFDPRGLRADERGALRRGSLALAQALD